MPIFLSAPDPPIALGNGLYAGLRSRGGLPTPLPLDLDQEPYVNAGLIDALSPALLRNLGFSEIFLRIVLRGRLKLAWYFLSSAGRIRHFCDANIGIDSGEPHPEWVDIRVPEILISDPTVALIYFRIAGIRQDATTTSTLRDWCFFATGDATQELKQKPLRIVSRSLGESLSIIKQHLAYQLHQSDLQGRFPELGFAPVPRLHIHESADHAYASSQAELERFQSAYPEQAPAVDLFYNPRNLGGGGNMCWAVNASLGEPRHQDDFVMMDSDTRVPFKTLYSVALISNRQTTTQRTPRIVVPVVAHQKEPTRVLEAGALFGRGTWQLAEQHAVQPCIHPFFHGCDLNEKRTVARLLQAQSSDYPPFIFSLYKDLDTIVKPESLLPAPFFLRGDDIEYGIHLRSRGANIQVLGSLVVFQDPKHSPWHEVMAILHATTLLLAYTERHNHGLLSRHLATYFRERMESHASIHDLHGLSIYQEVLTRLVSLLEINDSDLLAHYYDPSYYLNLRRINKPYEKLNYMLAESIGKTMPDESYQELPFLYFPRHRREQSLPDSIMLMNHLAETAALHHPREFSSSDVQSACQLFEQTLSALINSVDKLHSCCRALFQRDKISRLLQDWVESSNIRAATTR